MEHPLSIVVGIQEASRRVGKDEVVRRQPRKLLLVLRCRLPSLCLALKTPRLQIVGELLRNVNDRKTLRRFSPIADIALVDST